MKNTVKAIELVGLEQVQIVLLGLWGHILAPVGKPLLISPNGEIGKPAVWIGDLCVVADRELVKGRENPIPTYNLYVY